MLHTHEPHFLRCVTTAFLLMGITMICTSTTQMMLAGDVGQGTLIVQNALHPSGEASISQGGNVVDAGVLRADDQEVQLLVGMLLILAGFGFHLLCLLRADGTLRHWMQRRRIKLPLSTGFRDRLV